MWARYLVFSIAYPWPRLLLEAMLLACPQPGYEISIGLRVASHMLTGASPIGWLVAAALYSQQKL